MNFVHELRIDVGGRLLPMGSVLADYQHKFFREIEPALLRLAGRSVDCTYRRFFNEWSRGAGKTFCLAVVILFLLLICRRRISGIGIAGDRDQARLIIDKVQDIVACNPVLGKLVEIQNWRIINRRTNSTFEILASDVSTSHGQTPDILIADEVVHWAATDLWHALLSASAKRPNSVVCVITNAGWTNSPWWSIREAIRADTERWRFSRLDHRVPWISDDDLAEQRRHLPTDVYRRLFENAWIENDGSAALESSDIERAKTLPCAPNTKQPGKVYFAAVDIGVRRDFSAVVTVSKDCGWSEPIGRAKPVYSSTTRALLDLNILDAPPVPTEYRRHPGSGLIELVSVRVWKPNGGRVELEEVESELLLLNQRFALSRVGADPFQAEYLIQRLQSQGVHVSAVDFTSAAHTEMAQSLLDAFRERRIAIYPHAQLESDLRSLRIQENARGYRLTAPRTADSGHADAGVALSLALMLSKSVVGPTLHQRQLVYN